MERHNDILGWLWIAYSAVIVVASTTGIIIFLFFVDDRQFAGELLFLAVGSFPGLIGGIWLLKRRSWARNLLIIFGAINLMLIPIGTILGLYTFWVLLKGETAELFREG